MACSLIGLSLAPLSRQRTVDFLAMGVLQPFDALIASSDDNPCLTGLRREPLYDHA